MSEFDDNEINGGLDEGSEFDGIRILGAEKASEILHSSESKFDEDGSDQGDIVDDLEGRPILSHRELDQHWTDPPTGQVPAILVDDSADVSFEEVTARTASWRSEHASDEDLDLDFITEDVPVIKDHNEAETDESEINETQVDKTEDETEDETESYNKRSEFEPYGKEEPYFNESKIRSGAVGVDSEQLDRISRRKNMQAKSKVKTTAKTSARSAGIPKSNLRHKAPMGDSNGDSNLGLRIATGVLVAGIASLAFYSGPVLALILVIVVAMLASLEYFTAVVKVGFRPAGIVAILGVFAAIMAAYLRGTLSLLSILGLTVATIFAWYIFSDSNEKQKERPVANIGVTFLGFVWIGFFASFAGLILSSNSYPNKHGVAYLAAVLIMAVFNDVGAFIFGRKFGSSKNHLFAKHLSPNKTWEGFVGGSLFTLLIAIPIGVYFYPWSLSHALELAVLVLIFSPLGDLIESMLKRDLKLKDFGSVLPGHGGILDRVDGILLCLPVTYVFLQLLHLS